jgi:hypothetical protein
MEEQSSARQTVDAYVALLKSKIPPMDHGALDSRLEELLNDPSADEDDAITILHQEFDPDHKA